MKKVIFSFVLICILLVSMFSLSASAVSAEVIDKAEIVANINTDGTVSVTETWTVSYINSSDSFYRNIDIYGADNTLTLLQKYDEVKDVSVKIDGNTAAESPSGVNTYSFMKSADGSSYDIVINCPSAQITREYEISYTLIGALKKNNGDANFSFMFIGKTFPYTSNNVAVTVCLPDGINAEKIGLPEGSDGVTEGNTVKFESKRVYDTFAVELYCDDSVFDNGALASYSAAAENMKKIGKAVVDVLPYIVVVIIILAVILFVLLPDRLLRFSSERKALKNLKTNENEDFSSLPDDVTACEAYKMLMPESRVRPKSTSKKVPALFAMAILECIEKGYIVPDDDVLIVGTPKQEKSEYILSVLNFVKTFSEKKGNRYIIDDSFAEKVSAECASRYDVMANYLATFYGLIPETSCKFFMSKTNKAKYQNVYISKIKASDIKNKPTFAQCIENVLSGRKTRESEIFAMLFSSVSADKLFDKGGEKGAKALCEAVNAMYKVFVKSR